MARSLSAAQPNRILDALTRAGYQPTPPRVTLARWIAGTRGYFTAADLLDRSRAERLPVGRATVFRSLDLLTELRIVERLDLPSGAHAYVLCEPDRHHHHLVCSTCGRSDDIADGELASVLAQVAERHGFTIEAHRLELFGLCPTCRDARPAQPALPEAAR